MNHLAVIQVDFIKETLTRLRFAKNNLFNIKSKAFTNNGSIPEKYTCDGDDMSPPLSWTGVPVGTKSIVIIVDDPDADEKTWVHWVIYDLSPSVNSLQENALNINGKQGITDFGKTGYNGPCPPSGTHRYFFKIYALDVLLNLPSGKTKQYIEEAMKGHILAQSELVGTYKRLRIDNRSVQ